MAEFRDNDVQVLTNVFVYGSLKKGHALHYCLRGQEFLGECQTVTQYRLFDCGSYPALVRVAANGVSVKGELFRVDQNCLTQLDIVECVNECLYQRAGIQLLVPFESLHVEAYFYRQSVTGLPDCGGHWEPSY